MAIVVSSLPTAPTANQPASEESEDTTTSDWDALRRLARKLEGDLDVRLSAFFKLGGFSDKRGSSNNMQWKTLEMEIEMLLAHLTEINEDISKLASATKVGRATIVMQRLTRHREILYELTQEFKRIKKNLISVKEHAELLTSVRNDINEHKTVQPSSNIKSERNLLRERAAMHGSITQIDEVIDRAEATRSALTTQRSAFSVVQGKLKNLNDKFPSIHGTLGAIKRKKSKDNIILSAVVALCTLFLVAYWFAK